MFKFNLVIPDAVYQKVMFWINKSNQEVSGFGSLNYDADKGLFTVRDAILLKQKVGPASTEIDPAAIGKAMYEMRDEPNALKWHWHSHVNMGVFWSADDRKLIDELGSQGWILASVFNKSREVRTAFSTMMDCELMGQKVVKEVFIDEIPTVVERFLPEDDVKQWEAQFSANVTEDKPVGKSEAWGYWKGNKWVNTKHKGFVKKADRSGFGYHKNEASKSTVHDADGMKYSWKYDKWVYNPLYDTALRTDNERVDMILTMDDDEVDVAFSGYEKRDQRFAELYDRARVAFEKFNDAERQLYLEAGHAQQ